MSRPVAWAILVGALALIYSLAFTTYEHQTGSWRVTESGGLTPITVTCPSPFAVLALGAEPEDTTYQEGICVMSSRTLVVEAIVVGIGAAFFAAKPATRARPTPIGPLSEEIRGRDPALRD